MTTTINTPKSLSKYRYMVEIIQMDNEEPIKYKFHNTNELCEKLNIKRSSFFYRLKNPNSCTTKYGCYIFSRIDEPDIDRILEIHKNKLERQKKLRLEKKQRK